MTFTYKPSEIILDDKGRPVREGDDLIIILDDLSEHIGVMQPPFNPDCLIYTVQVDEDIDTKEINTIMFYSPVKNANDRLAQLLTFLNITINSEGNMQYG